MSNDRKWVTTEIGGQVGLYYLLEVKLVLPFLNTPWHSIGMLSTADLGRVFLARPALFRFKNMKLKSACGFDEHMTLRGFLSDSWVDFKNKTHLFWYYQFEKLQYHVPTLQ